MAGKWTRRGAVTALIAGLCTVLAVPAFAFASHVTKMVTVNSGAQGTATATCPAGQHITFGGIGAPIGVPLDSGPQMFPQQFFADSTQTKWTTVAVNGQRTAANHPGTLTSHAYCGPHSTRTVVTKTVSVLSGNVGVATAKCPTGDVVLGGGYKTTPVTPYPYTLITRLRAPTSTTVEVAAVRFASTPSTSLTAIAYCGAGPALTEVTASITTDGNASSAPPVTATCPVGKNVMWGGMWGQFPSATSETTPQVLPFSMTAPSKTQWKVVGYNPRLTPGFLRALAYCR